MPEKKQKAIILWRKRRVFTGRQVEREEKSAEDNFKRKKKPTLS